jgi:hypothetical protein
MSKKIAYVLSLSFLLIILAGCAGEPAKEGSSDASTTGEKSSANKTSSPGLLDRITSKPITVPAGTVFTVRLGDAVGSKISQPGESFSATLAEPIQVDGKVVIPDGSSASGTIVDAQPLGKFKGGARLQLRLDSVEVKGKSYNLQTASVNRAIKGKGKRTATMIGGGAGAGALIGALAGGGKGAAIGAAVGAGAGTAGAAYTGNKEILLPVESALSFKSLEPVEINQ